jgi:hypothetical protein
MSRIGFVLLAVGLTVIGLGAAAIMEPAPGLVMGTVMTVIGATIALIGRRAPQN